MDKVKCIKILMDSVKLYESNLANKNALVIFKENDTKSYSYIEFLFFRTNFLHLTGIEFYASNENNQKSMLFYNKCLNGELSINDFGYKKDGTTQLKLEILTEICSINKTAKMIGNYDNSKPALTTDKLCGNIRACMGSIRNENNYYIPNTALKEDIRNIVHIFSPIVAIYTKNVDDEKYNYTNLGRSAKQFDFDDLPNSIKQLFE